MARSRNIKPSLFKNETLGTEDPLLTILFAGLWCLADRRGVLENRPRRIKAELFPYRDMTLPEFQGLCTVLARCGFIELYEWNEIPLIQIVNFEKHQSPHRDEKPSEYPTFIEVQTRTVQAPCNTGFKTPDSLNLIPDSLQADSLKSVSESEPDAAADFAAPQGKKRPRRTTNEPEADDLAGAGDKKPFDVVKLLADMRRVKAFEKAYAIAFPNMIMSATLLGFLIAKGWDEKDPEHHEAFCQTMLIFKDKFNPSTNYYNPNNASLVAKIWLIELGNIQKSKNGKGNSNGNGKPSNRAKVEKSINYFDAKYGTAAH